MKLHKFGFPEKPLSNESREKLCLENEILRLKLKAQTGGELHNAQMDLPPEVEHFFLKNILAFEESMAKSRLISVYDFLEKPSFKKTDELDDTEIEMALAELLDCLFRKQITVDFDKLQIERDKYRFITEDLFLHEINDVQVQGMFLHFTHEEFYPDHEADIRRRALEFISDWFDRSMGKFSWELAEEFILPDGEVMTKAKVLEKFNLIFSSYTSFADCQYIINDIHYELKENDTRGLACAEGGVKYQAVLENGETKFIEGPFKLFLSMEYNCWRIFFFIFPGFEWE